MYFYGGSVTLLICNLASSLGSVACNIFVLLCLILKEIGTFDQLLNVTVIYKSKILL